ncbi:MAG: hypothetical protein E2O76_08130 [Caldithrix sp.]|nr:MAG: hypothetical protein E2O76_08130 [Caldithrix sp.]
MMTVFTDIVLAAANNNLAKLVANELDINNDFSFGTVMLIQPEKKRLFVCRDFISNLNAPVALLMDGDCTSILVLALHWKRSSR